jgi:RNA polymerase sigma-70 factor (ECF subfamily)
MHDLEKIIQRCKKNDPKAQKELYDYYAPILYAICLRYVSEKSAAADILQEGFLKILTKIDDYSGLGSFEGWMKRVIINTAITDYHKNKKYSYHLEITEIKEIKTDGNQIWGLDFTQEELLNVIKTLPEGYRIVFNMYAIEGFKHKEIAREMNIDVSTSKSQYSRAKKLIQKKLAELSKIKLHE